jgi:hypothetical protein
MGTFRDAQPDGGQHMTDDHTHRGDDVHSVEAAEMEANGGWQPIETAPKNGTFIWVYDPNSEWQCEAWWDDRFNGWQCPHEGVAPSHWRPIPAAPTEGE